MKIFAHRGLVFEYPENSLLSLRKALQQGFSLEVDVHRTKDGKLLVIHDNNALSTTGVDAVIPESDFSYLRTLDYAAKSLDGKFAGQGIIIPTLEELFELFRKEAKEGAIIAIQVKDCSEDEIEKLIVEALDKFDKQYPAFDIYSRVFVFDPVIESAKKFKQLQPKLKISLSIGEDSRFPDARYPTIYTYDSVKDNPNWEIVWADEWVDGLYSKEFIDRCHANNKLVYAISSELHGGTNPKHPLSESYVEIWKKLIEWEVDGICTDYPNKLRELLERINHKENYDKI